MSKETTTDAHQTPQLQRSRALEQLEGLLERCLTREEKAAFEIGYNMGLEQGLTEAGEMIGEHLKEMMG